MLVLVAVATAGCGGGPLVLSGYRELYKPYFNAPRNGMHPAIDFGGNIGDPVLAGADGIVHSVIVNHPLCGNGLWLSHAPHTPRFTLYCQMHETHVGFSERVKRGQVIGLLGDTGEAEACRRARGSCPMLHFGLFDVPRSYVDGDLDGAHDPMSFIVGCFDPAKTYPTDRLVLTYPVRC